MSELDSIPRKSSAAILFSIYMCLEATSAAANVTGPTWRALFSLSNKQLGLCLGASQAGIMIASVFAGHVTQRRGPLRVLNASMIGVLLGLCLLGSAVSYQMLFLGLATIGLCAAALYNAGAVIFSGIFPFKMRRIMSFASALWFGSSLISAPLVGHWLEHASAAGWQAWSFRLPFLAMVALLAACLVLVRLRLRWSDSFPWQTGTQDTDPAAPRSLRRERLWIPALGFCHGMMLIALLAWLNPMAQDVFGVSDFLGSLMLGMAALGLAAGRLSLAAFHSRIRIDDRYLLAVSCSSGAVLLALALMVPNYWLALALVGLGTFSSSASAPCLFSLVTERFPQSRSRLFGYMESTIAAAAISGSFLFGLLSDMGVPLRVAMGLSPLAALAMAAGALIWKMRSTRPSVAAGPRLMARD